MSRTATLLLAALATLHARRGRRANGDRAPLGSIAYVTGPITGWVAYLDISRGQLQPVVTPPLAPGACPPGKDVQLQTTVDFATKRKTIFSINANLGPEAPPYKPALRLAVRMLVSNARS
jgi:hypothetical protein